MPQPVLIHCDAVPKAGTFNPQDVPCYTENSSQGYNAHYNIGGEREPENMTAVCDAKPEPPKGNMENKNTNKQFKPTTQPINRRALSNLATTYKLELFDKNLMVIFNQINIDGYKPRKGTDYDVKELTNTFEQFGFIVQYCPDYTKEEIFKTLDDLDNTDFTDYGCVAVAILTHGSDSGTLFAKNPRDPYTKFEILERLNSVNKPTLVTKPKLVFIQAYRGFDSTHGITDSAQPYHLPLEADTLVFHSSFVGKSSQRPEDSSWFIQMLCSKIKELGHKEDLLTICTEIQREVSCNEYYKSDTTHFDRPGITGNVAYHKQMPIVTSNLIRKFYFKRAGLHMPLDGCIEKNIDIVDAPCLMTAAHKPTEQERKKAQQDEDAAILDHLDYMKSCLKHYVEENLFDTNARYLLQSACLPNQIDPKLTLIAISHLLQQNLGGNYTKYIHFYDVDMETNREMKINKETTENCKSNKIEILLNNYTMLGMMGIAVGCAIMAFKK